MQTFIATFFVLLAIIGMMSVGYWVKRKTIAGSCGGLANVGADKICECPEPCDKRKAKMAQEAKEEKRQAMLEEHRII